MVNEEAHRQVLLDLLNLDLPVSELYARLSAVPYDYQGENVVLTVQHVTHALQRFLDETLSADELESWAELVEGRPGVEYDCGAEEILSTALFKLSTPAINAKITRDLCWRMLTGLRAT